MRTDYHNKIMGNYSNKVVDKSKIVCEKCNREKCICKETQHGRKNNSDSH